MTFESSRFRPMRKPMRKTAAASRTAGLQSGLAAWTGRPRTPATAVRGGGLLAGASDPPLDSREDEPVRHLTIPEKEANRPFLRKARFRARGVRTRHARSRHHQDGGCREQAPQCCLRNDQSLLPTKLAGVTSTIAIACDTILPRPSSTSAVRIPRLPP